MKRGAGHLDCPKCMIKEEFIVDRLEDGYIVVETSEGNRINIKAENIIGETREGDVLIKQDNMYIADFNKTEIRKRKIKNLVKGMWEY